MDRTKISYAGFEPDDELRDLLHNIMESLSREAPSDSSLQLNIEKNVETFGGRFRVASCAGIFVSEASDPCPRTLAEGLLEQIRVKLGEWKLDRFEMTPEAD